MSRDALVVGINNYQYEGFPQLRTPATDAEAIAKQLERHGEFNVRRLPEAIDPSTKTPFVGKKTQVTLAQLQDTLIQLFKPEGNQVPDTAVFFFSGHGLRVTQGVPEGFLATSDIYPPAKFNGLSLRWLRELLQESPIKQQIVWLDCCHSGELLNLREADPGERGKTRDRCFIAASRDFEKAFEDMGSEYSILTKYLLEGLDPTRCPQRWVTNYSLVEFLSVRLQAEPQRPTFTNFGEPINLTRSWEVQTTETVAEVSADICPYKGLEYFDCSEEDPKYFFGREDLTDQLIDRLRQDNFLAILGASGSGKSSVLRAGLLHQLQLGRKLSGSDRWQVCIFFPGEHPLENLALAFVERDLPRLERAERLGKAEGLLKEGAEGLRRLVLSGESSRTLVVVDQFEELFTLCQDILEREQFLECLLGALERVGERLSFILAMRADFFGKCVEREYSGLAKQIQNKMIAVPPMSREQLRHAIVKPARRVGLEVEGELVEKAIADLEGSPGSLPLLQYTLKELWKERRNNQLRLATYIQLGGIGGTLDKRASEVYEKLEPLQKEAAKHIFLALTRLGEGTEDTRRRVAKRDLVTAKHSEALVEKTIQVLAGEKLVVTSQLTEKGSELGRTAVIDVAHEALIRHWQLLRGWLRENRGLLWQQRKIEAAAVEWRDRSKRGDYLLRGRRLKEARDFQKQQFERFALSEVAQELIKRSVKKKRFDLLKSSMVFLIIPLIGTGFLVREVLLYLYVQTVDGCPGVETCEGRREALEGLVKAGRRINHFNLKNAYLEKTYLSGVDLSGVNLSEVNLKKAYLRGANLTGADLTGADLTGADLTGAKLIGADLTGADLTGAKLIGADLTRAQLTGVDLTGAKLTKAKLTGANLWEADLMRADLRGVDLRGARLSADNITYRIYSWELKPRAANLTEANLTGAYLSGANLSETDLSRAYLIGTNLIGTDFSGADLGGANLTGANLKVANLKEANLSGSDLRVADLDGAKNLTPDQVKKAWNWDKAIYDDDFRKELGLPD